jgi:hypothetical protein
VTLGLLSGATRLLAVGLLAGLGTAVLPDEGLSASGADGSAVVGPAAPMTAPIGSPSAVGATTTDAQAVVRWSMLAPDVGPPIDNYVVTSIPAGLDVVVPSTQRTAVVNGLTNGTAYAFAVAASNPAGPGPESRPSNIVHPAPLISVTSTVSLRSVNAMFNGGVCLYGGVECFGIQQNLYVQGATAKYWLQNIVFVEETARHGWEARGAYEIWNGTQQTLLACSGHVTAGPVIPECDWTGTWRPVTFPTHIVLGSAVKNSRVDLRNSVGGPFPSWVPATGGIDHIISPLGDAVMSASWLLGPELVVVGEIGRHIVTFNGGSGAMSTLMTLANGRVLRPGTTCVTQSGVTSTGEQSVGLYWKVAASQSVAFAAHGGTQGDGDGVGVLPTSQPCR